MELLEAYKEAEQGMLAAWNDAQAFFDEHLSKTTVLDSGPKLTYEAMIERVEHYYQQLDRLRNTIKFGDK